MTDAYKGVRDFYPEDLRVQNYIFDVMRHAVESYGYEEMNASVLESTELYTAKTSEEIVHEQTYTFTDRGDRSVTLRPEMTPTVARMVAHRRRDLAMPLRLYSIQNFFRYERPQRGRLREFWQLNADLFGADEVEADAEIITLAYRVMEGFGADDNMFSIRVGSRKALDKAMDEAGLTGDSRVKYRTLLDGKNKMDAKEYTNAVHEISPIDPLSLFESSTAVKEELSRLTLLRHMLEERGIMTLHDPSVVRGFEYYTDIVFEMFDTDAKNPRAIAGGGRYDKLIEAYGGDSLPAVGFAMGDVVISDFLETRKLLPPLQPVTYLYIAPVSENDVPRASKFADELRRVGIPVALGMKHKKIGDHIKAAEKHGIPYFAAFGEKEANGTVVVKRLRDGKESEMTLATAPTFFDENE